MKFLKLFELILLFISYATLNHFVMMIRRLNLEILLCFMAVHA